jgi:hypothetical protein
MSAVQAEKGSKLEKEMNKLDYSVAENPAGAIKEAVEQPVAVEA